jgi:hypothetical protein
MQRNRDTNLNDGIDIALGGIAPILVAAALVAVRGEVRNTNVAFVLAVVVVAAGAMGGRAAGMLSGLTAAASFDFFHTVPYLSLLIHDAHDLEITGLLPLLGLVSGRLASKALIAARQRDGGRGGLAQIRPLVDEMPPGAPPADVIAIACAELVDRFQLSDCHFEDAPFADRLDLPQLERNGVVAHRRYRLQPGGVLELELAAEAIALPVISEGRIVGRFILDFGPSAGATLEQRMVAIALADQVGAALHHARDQSAGLDRMRTAAPINAASSDPARIPIFAWACSASSAKARPVMNSDTVKPIPATPPAPSSCRNPTPAGSSPNGLRTIVTVAPTTPASFPTTSPITTAQVNRLSSASASDCRSRATPALARAKTGITR